jgi:hypothetical protein
MKSYSYFSRHSARFLTVIALTLGLAILPAMAQHVGPFDSQDSYSGLFLGSSENPYAWNVGVSAISGQANLDNEQPEASAFDFSMASQDTTVTFKSKRASLVRDNLWQVTGDLTIARVERSIEANASEDYAGPVYGEPVTHSVTREATFVLAVLDDPALDGHPEILGSSAIGRENFPELVAGITEDGWSKLAGNYDCRMPASAGEDYSGVSCEGQLIEAKANAENDQRIGEDFSGSQSATPHVNQLRIVLRISLPENAMIAWAVN